ncbi:MAG: hypothetical protein DMH00_06645 [Acidobacteria bacterium]|nr:MAG: hypothetical protein DMH00_06645 [Acidobacteriota bacterium]
MPARRLLSTLCILVLLAAGSPRAAGENTSHFHAAPGVPEKFPEHPAVGETAPDFALQDTDGKPLALGEYLGRGYLVLAFGSASSANFRKSERMEVKVLLIYTREAHPATLREKAPKSYRDRTQLARQIRKDLKINLKILVDGWDDEVHRSYGAMPDAAFLLDPKGVILVRQLQARAPALEHQLRLLLSVPEPAPQERPRKEEIR